MENTRRAEWMNGDKLKDGHEALEGKKANRGQIRFKQPHE